MLYGEEWPGCLRLYCKARAAAVGCKIGEVFLASTGVIGEPLKASAFAGVMETLESEASNEGYFDAAKAIMTTDTFPKLATASARLGRTTRHHQTASPRAPE